MDTSMKYVPDETLQINWERLRKFMNNDPRLAEKFVKRFQAESLNLTKKMEAFYSVSAWEDLSLIAHTLKSQIRYLGISPLEEIALYIEREAEQKSAQPRLMNKISELEDLLEKTFRVNKLT